MSHWYLTTTLLLTLVKCCLTVDPYRNFWYSPYGETDYGRSISQGVNLGKLSMVQCSRFCSDSDLCQAYQFHKTDGRLGTCYTFNSLTYNMVMVPAPGHKYFEKRDCFESYRFTAAILFPSELRLILFTGEKTFMFDVMVQSNLITFRGLFLGSHNNFFPGLTGTVDGAFQGPSNFTYIIQGTNVKCFKPVHANHTLFKECGPGEAAMLRILDPYFATQPYLNGIVSIDNSDNIHVITDNIVYRLTWSNGDTQYNIVDSFPTTDTGSIWKMAPVNVTAIARTVNADTYLVIEDYKMTIYSSSAERVSGIMFVCKTH